MAVTVFDLIVTGPKSAVTYPLEPGSYVIGSASGCDVLLHHAYASEQHARLDCTTDACTLTDLDSTNGTFIDGQRLRPGEPVLLPPRAVAEIGLFQLSVQPVVATNDETATAAGQPDDQQADQETAVAPAPKQVKANGSGGNGVTGPPAVWLAGGSSDFPEALRKLGLERNYCRYLQYLPAIYDVPFMHRFLALFESFLAPIEWRVDNLALYLDPQTAPAEFLPWLAQWYSLRFDHTWDEQKRRRLLEEAPGIFAYWGTRTALSKVLEVYLGQAPVILDDESLPPFTFKVEIPLPAEAIDQAAIEQLIDWHKPAFTSYELIFCGVDGED